MQPAPCPNRFDTKLTLEGIRQWVEVETPTEAQQQINKLAEMVADGYPDLPAKAERVAGRDGCGDHRVARSTWGQDAQMYILSIEPRTQPLHRLYQTLR
jgi:glutamate carboxypeptidase